MKVHAVVFVGGVVFAIGLCLAGLVRQEVVLSFLQLEDLGLAVMMAAAVAVSLPAYQIATRARPRPLLGGAFDRYPRRVAPSHVVGGMIFGIGWGVSGVCPGAALASLGLGNWPMLAGLAGMLAGAYLQGIWANRAASLSARGPIES